MRESNEDQTAGPSWTCSGCGRRLPSGLTVCRCGTPRPGTAKRGRPDPAASRPPRAKARAGPTPRGLVFVLAGLAVATFVLGGTVLWLLSSRSRPPPAAPTTGPRAPAATSPSPSGEGPRRPEPPVAPEAPRASTGAPPPLEDLLGEVLPAVVGLESEAGTGSGFFVGPGLIVTNRHVVAGVHEVAVKTSDGQGLQAKVYVRARDFDLALLQLYGSPPPHAVLRLAPLSDLRVGQEVVAVGSPLGLQNTVTRGIVSAIRTEGGVTLVQSDASINPGNSGGPLVDRRGRVVGVTTKVRKLAGLGSLGLAQVGEALGFSIASDHAQAFVDGKLATIPFEPASERDPLAAWRREPVAPTPAPPGEPSTAEVMRIQGDRVFEANVQQMAEYATRVDALWMRYEADCAGGRTSAGVRPWLGLTGSETAFGGCGSLLGDIQRRAESLKAAMAQAEEQARRAGVLPGRVRELRALHRLEW